MNEPIVLAGIFSRAWRIQDFSDSEIINGTDRQRSVQRKKTKNVLRLSNRSGLYTKIPKSE